MANPSSSWPVSQDLSQYVGDNERRVAALERRTRIPKASQILGPGIAPWAVRLFDWNDDTTLYNGIFYSELGALNSPNSTKRWIGTSYATAEGSGVQEVVEFGDGVTAPEEWRRLFAASPGSTRVFGAWEHLNPVPRASRFQTGSCNYTVGEANAILMGGLVPGKWHVVATGYANWSTSAAQLWNGIYLYVNGGSPLTSRPRPTSRPTVRSRSRCSGCSPCPRGPRGPCISTPPPATPATGPSC